MSGGYVYSRNKKRDRGVIESFSNTREDNIIILFALIYFIVICFIAYLYLPRTDNNNDKCIHSEIDKINRR